MTFIEATRTCLRKYADFNGTAGRPEYWWFMLFQVIVLGVPSLIATLLLVAGMPMDGNPEDVNGALFALAIGLFALVSLGSLALLLPSLAVSARRLHDIGLSGWLLLLSLVPLGGLALFVMSLLPSKPAVTG